jgi:hypothetical protein
MELKDQIRECLAKTQKRASHLAAAAGVYPSVISRIRNGKQADVSGKNYQRIVAAIQELEAQHG